VVLGYLNDYLADGWRDSSAMPPWSTRGSTTWSTIIWIVHPDAAASSGPPLSSRGPPKETARGRSLATIRHLAESFMLAPVRNEAFRIILWPFLKRKCLGTMPR